MRRLARPYPNQLQTHQCYHELHSSAGHSHRDGRGATIIGSPYQHLPYTTPGLLHPVDRGDGEARRGLTARAVRGAAGGVRDGERAPPRRAACREGEACGDRFTIAQRDKVSRYLLQADPRNFSPRRNPEPPVLLASRGYTMRTILLLSAVAAAAAFSPVAMRRPVLASPMRAACAAQPAQIPRLATVPRMAEAAAAPEVTAT